MRGGQTRFVLAALVLAVFWGIVYWSAPAAREPAVRVAAADERAAAPASPPAKPGARTPANSQFAKNTARQDELASLSSVTKEKASASKPSSPDRAGVIAPEFRDYVVKSGQTIHSIAREVFGNDKKWEAIARANPRIDPLHIKPGMTLRIPVDPKNVQGKSIEPAPGAAEFPREKETAAASHPNSKGSDEYVVKEGDTLSGIAKRLLGNRNDWQAILDANKGTLSDENDIRPGMTLKIPAKKN